MSELTWLRVDQWTTRGGSELGTNRKLPDVDIAGIAQKIKDHKIDGLLLVGGFEALISMRMLDEARGKHRELNIPIVQLPGEWLVAWHSTNADARSQPR